MDELIQSLQKLRERAMVMLMRADKRLLIAGLHPFSNWHEQPLYEGEAFSYYTNLIHEYQDISRGAMSFGMHLHLGLPSYMPKIQIMNHLRHILPEILALSVSSPFIESRDTGLQSWRHSILDRYPRMGIPDVWNDEQHYQTYIQRLRNLKCLQSEQSVWQDLRLHQRYETLEIRIMDTHPELERIALIVRLVHAEVQKIWAQIQKGILNPPVALDRCFIEENKWKARRYGLDADWIDWERDELCPGYTHFQRWIERLSPYIPSDDLHLLEKDIEKAFAQGTFASEMRRERKKYNNWEDFAKWLSFRTHTSIEINQERYR